MAMSTSTSPEANDRTKSSRQQGSSQPKRILVVEDNQLSLTLLHQVLKAHGYEILQTPEGRAAIDLARDQQPDLILMDIGLPDICGLDVTRLLKQDDRTKAIPIIAVTAFAMPGDEKKALDSGCDAYFAKPISLDNLLRTIESMLSTSPPAFGSL